jgi:hypothetical protein
MSDDEAELRWQEESLERARREGERIAALHAAHDFAALRVRLVRQFRDVVLPSLRSIGFRGSPPNLYRVRENVVDVVMLQVDRYGGGFAVNLGTMPLSDGDAAAVRLRSIPFEDRARLTRDPEGLQDRWYRYDGPTGTPEDQQDAALREVAALTGAADEWLRTGHRGGHVIDNR